jgi:hypothetical protein
MKEGGIVIGSAPEDPINGVVMNSTSDAGGQTTGGSSH